MAIIAISRQVAALGDEIAAAVAKAQRELRTLCSPGTER